MNISPDATQFLSTASVLVGIFLTVTTTGLLTGLPARLELLAAPEGHSDSSVYTGTIRRILFELSIINLRGTMFPFVCLFLTALVRLSSMAYCHMFYIFDCCSYDQRGSHVFDSGGTTYVPQSPRTASQKARSVNGRAAGICGFRCRIAILRISY
jgi:hypothetical protein